MQGKGIQNISITKLKNFRKFMFLRCDFVNGPKFVKITYYNNMGDGYEENWAIWYVNTRYRARKNKELEFYYGFWQLDKFRINPWTPGTNPP